MAPGQIGRYQILGLLGQGGMGRVYHAYDPHLDREVVVKLVTLSDPTSNQEWRQRFKREVQAAGRLNHPHIVTVYDVSLDHDPPYVVMELLTGGTLYERLKPGALPWSEILSLFQPLIQALAYAHQASVIHRDIKPSNIMFAGDRSPSPAQGSAWETLKLVDFGLARRLDDQMQLTQAGVMFGTPAYMSPEQARGDVVDARTDIFAVGIVLFEAITGQNPLDKGSLFATLAETTSPTPVDLSPLTNKAPLEVVHLIERAVAKECELRYATDEAFLADLTLCLEDAPSFEPIRTDPLPSVAKIDTRFLTEASSEGPVIHKARHIDLTSEIESVLRIMFNRYSRLAIEMEFGQGMSGGRVFRVRPIEADGRAHLPAVVKIAPINLIRQEWQAYQTWVVNTLPGVARLESAPTLPPGSLWDGLRYTLVGGGAFEVQSLASYYRRATPEDLAWVLTERLYQMIGVHWWLERHLDRAFQMQADYDAILPVNLLLQPIAPSNVANAYPITPEHLPLSALMQDDIVHLAGFMVTEIDPKLGQVTLNLPSPVQGRSATAYRLRLVDVPTPDRYQVGQVINSLIGQVTATRHDLLVTAAAQALGPAVNLSAERLTPPPAQNVPPALSLPNPLLAYQDLLHDFLTVNIATVHGDLNMENILIDPDTRHLNLIDFATVRQGHVLHDLLRLETEVLTRFVPASLAETDLSPTTIYAIYQQLDLATHQPAHYAVSEELSPALEKPWAMLAAIRKMARTCLFNPEDWTEYYHGLILYLLGALKFKNLDQAPTAPLPKQVAFWGAATLVDLLHKPPTAVPVTKPGVIIRWPLLIVAIVEALVILALVMLVGIIGPFGRGTIEPSAGIIKLIPEKQLASIIGLSSEVEVERTGTEHLTEVDFGVTLYQGDVLHTRTGATVAVVCKNGLILSLLEQRNMDIEMECRRETTAAQVIGRLNQALAEQLVTPPPQSSKSTAIEITAITERTTREAQRQMPLLLTPRNTLVANSRPPFRWQPIPDASGYRLSVTLAGGETWERETSDTSLPYPDDVPRLVVGGANIVELTTLDDETGEAVDKTSVRMLAGASMTELFETRDAIQTLGLDEVAERFILAQLYRRRALWTAAIAELEQLTQAHNLTSANLWQQLGGLYAEVGLYVLAEESYYQALTFAESEQNPGAQAAAQVGLARTALVFGESEQTIGFLTAAENLYRMAGQDELANRVKAELAELK